MSVSKEEFYKKLHELVPELVSRLNPELVGPCCEDESVQPFLKWFNKNVSCNNILTEEEIEISKEIKKSGHWLTGQELDNELEEALKDFPELEDFLSSESNSVNQPIPEYAEEKEAYNNDLEYLQCLQNQYKKLKRIETDWEDQLEKDEEEIKKQQVQVVVSYEQCLELMHSLHTGCQEFLSKLSHLVEIYKDPNKSANVCTWLQMPIDTFIKHLETRSNYLNLYIKRQFGDKMNFSNSSMNQTLLNNSDLEDNDLMSKLMECKHNSIEAQYNDLEDKSEEVSLEACLKAIKNLYNDGNVTQIPQSSNQFRMEIKDLLGRKDYLIHSIESLNIQLRERVEGFWDTEVKTFLVEVAQNKLQYQEQLLAKLDTIVYLAREQGHSYSDILCLLMSSQHLLISQLYHFAKDAQHYFQSEYALVNQRCESMHRLQEDYRKATSHPIEKNVFNKLFVNIMECESETDIYKSVQEFEALIKENEESRKAVENKCFSAIEKVVKEDKSCSKIYLGELDNGLTRSFQSTDNALSAKLEDIAKKVDSCRFEFTAIHNKLKDVVKKIDESPLEREKAILWQTFLAAPEKLQLKYDSLTATANKMHFAGVASMTFPGEYSEDDS